MDLSKAIGRTKRKIRGNRQELQYAVQNENRKEQVNIRKIKGNKKLKIK